MSSIFPDAHAGVVVCDGRPADVSGRLAKEIAVYDLLDSLGVAYRRVDHEAIFTAEGCAWVKQLLGIPICKNLFLTDRCRTTDYLLLMPGEKRFSTREFSHLIGSSRLSFAPEEDLLRLLDLTPGSVSVLVAPVFNGRPPAPDSPGAAPRFPHRPLDGRMTKREAYASLFCRCL